jgi:tRNA 5-methylaminomethyl-2-thiouridine biosynthesis bifunctional protein
VYFSAADGLEEARSVFLAGCGLPQAWAGRRQFCVAELGFGTGLNLAALLDLWRRTREPGAHLSLFSVEAHPIRADEARRALRRWPQIADIAGLLTSRWPGRARGFHRVDLPEFCATLDVAILPASQALAAWSGTADAWFLDGFAPARNPAMWTADLMALVAARSAPGARAATFTVSGQVRRDLAAAGFAVERKPGFGTKRQRLEARLPGIPIERGPPPRVAIVGAGIAGAALARAFAARGVAAAVFDAVGPGAGASSGVAVLASPRLDAGLGPHAEVFAQAMRRAACLYDRVPGGIVARAALQLEAGPKDAGRFAAIAASDLFEPGAIRRLDSDATSSLLGEAAPAGLLIEPAAVVNPEAVLAAWLDHVDRARVADLEALEEGGWRLLGEDGQTLFIADVVCVAGGAASADLIAGLGLTPVRGQASLCPGFTWPIATLFGGYVIPNGDGLLFGATHDRGDADPDPRAGDHARNLDLLAAALPQLAARLASTRPGARSGVRATTSDYMPSAGPAPAAAGGVFVLTGLGSRGFTVAPLLAEHVAALALGAPSPLPSPVAALVDPARFARRARRRGGA